MPRRSTVWLLALLGTACVHRPPLTRLETETPITLVTILDQKDGAAIDREPPELLRALTRQLKRRNLVAERLAPEQVAPLGQTLDTKARLELLGTALGPGKLFLLVELRATLGFSDIEGGYKWNVESRLTAAASDGTAAATTADYGTAVFLHQDFEHETEALQGAAVDLADRVGILLDTHFAGRSGTQGAPPTGARGDWSAKPMYFVLLDRFAPGEGKAERVNRADPDDWHGGSLATLRRHLDDLQALGVGSVWLSPVSSCREEKLGVFGPSHCYWVTDLGTVERRFGTLADVRALRDELHARGMRLVLDVVLNHVAPASPLLAAHPDWIHPRLAITDFEDPEQLERGWLGGLPDLAQEKPAVADYLIATTRRWIEEVRPDGLRLDAVKHVPLAFWARFSRELHAAAPGLLLIGEDLDGDPARLSRVTREGGFDALFDFPLRSAILGAACEEKPVGAVAARLGLDRLDAPGRGWATLLDDHDLPRLATSCSDFEHAAAALDLLFLLRGLPTLTYGVEAGLTGQADPANRGDLDFPVGSPYRALLAKLASLRAGHAALATGRTAVVHADRDGFVLYRVAPGEAACVRLFRGEANPLVDRGWTRLLSERRGALTIDVEVSTGAEAIAFVRGKLAAAPPRALRFEVQGVPTLDRGDAVAVVGSAPELGAWDPHRAVPAALPIALPSNSAYELKLVVRRARGNVEWQPGENDVVFVAAGEAPETITLRWNPT